MSGKLTVVVGGQYGSEGKGAVAGYLSRAEEFGTGVAVRVAGPNAGHSAVGADGKKWALRQIPVAAVTNPNAELVIAAGSEIDPAVLQDEVQRLDKAGFAVSSRLTVDPQATVILPEDTEQELDDDLVGRIGSTGKGVGAARAGRIMRQEGRTVADWCKENHHAWDASLDTTELVMGALHKRRNVLIEGTQGYGLGLHAGHYPQCTSSDCRAVDFMSMAGVSPWAPPVQQLAVWVVFRPYPIRVAGNSGPLLGETTWEGLGLPVEKTTVTQKVRRVGAWDAGLARAAMKANGGGMSGSCRMALTMADQLVPELIGCTNPVQIDAYPPLRRFITRAELDAGGKVWLVGTGPDTVMDLR